jgi:hypothetical protein
MLLFRSFAIGLLGACFVLLATRPQSTVVVAHPSQVVVAQPSQIVLAPSGHDGHDDDHRTGNDVTVVDVARGLPGVLIAQSIVLAANERIVAIDDVAVRDGAATLSAIELQGRSYLDVVVANDAGTTRRVLVLAR